MPHAFRKLLVLQPLGEFKEGKSPDIGLLHRFAKLFFGLPAKVLPKLDSSKLKLTTRRDPNNGRLQVLAGDILRHLKRRLEAKHFCILAVTMLDLYPSSSWNYVFGLASLKERVGVFSFARFHTASDDRVSALPRSKLLLLRSLKTLAHETGHMLGMRHCVFFNCVMKGSNHLAESDGQPLHLCPICLRKLMWAVSIDPVERYRRLEEFYRLIGLEKEAKWIESRLRWIERRK